MTLVGLVVVALALVAAWRRLERYAYLKMGEEYERRVRRADDPEDRRVP